MLFPVTLWDMPYYCYTEVQITEVHRDEVICSQWVTKLGFKPSFISLKDKSLTFLICCVYTLVEFWGKQGFEGKREEFEILPKMKPGEIIYRRFLSLS